ncbi:MAG: hypothetical protein AAGF86_19435 [Pseudomonadota bacterium]
MATRYDVMGTRKPRGFARGGRKTPKKELPLGRAVWGFFVLLSLHAVVAGVLFYFYPALFDAPTDQLATPGNRTNFCTKVFMFIPEHWESVTVCRLSNAVPFLLMPSIVLVYILGRVAKGRF